MIVGIAVIGTDYAKYACGAVSVPASMWYAGRRLSSQVGGRSRVVGRCMQAGRYTCTDTHAHFEFTYIEYQVPVHVVF